MKNNRTLLALCIYCLLGISFVHSKSIVPEPNMVFELEIPSELKSLYLDKPTVTMVVAIDQEGQIVDRLSTWATHYGLLNKAETYIDKVEWKPRVENGQTVAFAFEVRLLFVDFEQEAWKTSGGSFTPMGSSSLDGMKAKLYRSSPDSYIYERSESNETDQPLSVIEGTIVLVNDATGQPAKGKVVVEYYVDQHGTVRFPTILETTNAFVAEATLKTLEKLKFSKPTKGNRPTYVKIRQPFNFS